MTAGELFAHTGLDPSDLEITGFADATAAPNDYAILAGTLRGCPLIVRGTKPGGLEGAVAMVSRSPILTTGELTKVEQERLRAESQTPLGADAPVGQDKAIVAVGAATVVPYAPPLPPVPSEPEPPRPEGEEVDVEPLDCTPGCFKMQGPEGVQEIHGPGCPKGDPD